MRTYDFTVLKLTSIVNLIFRRILCIFLTHNINDDITLEGNQFLIRPLLCIKQPLKEFNRTSISPSSSCKY